MNDNYTVINGKKIELTEKQIKALGIEVKTKRNRPFKKVVTGDVYYFINEFNEFGDIGGYTQTNDCDGTARFNNSNCFNGEPFAQQVALHGRAPCSCGKRR